MAKRLLLVVLGVLCLAHASAAQAIKAQMPEPVAGDTTISGFVLPAQTSAAGFVLEIWDVAGGGHRFVDRVAVDRFESTGKFAVKLPDGRALAANQRVELKRREVAVAGGTVDVKPQPPAAAPVAVPTGQLREAGIGDDKVSGQVLPPQGNATGYFLEILDVDGATTRFAGRYAINAFESAGTFAVTLGSALTPKQRVRLLRGTTELDHVDVPDTKPSTVRLLPLHAGDKTVAGVLLPVPKDADVKRFAVEVKSAGGTLKARKLLTQVEAGSGSFSVALDGPLHSTDVVNLTGATAVNVAVPPFTDAVSLIDSLHDGSRIVRGTVASKDAVAMVRVVVLPSSLENSLDGVGIAGQLLPRYVQIKDTGVSTLSAAGEFTLTLDQPLVAGQVVYAEARTASDESGAPSSLITVTDPGSWGRARAYFAGGIVWAKDRDDFSKQDLTLALAVDKSVLQRADFTLPAERAVRDALLAPQLTPCRDARATVMQGLASAPANTAAQRKERDDLDRQAADAEKACLAKVRSDPRGQSSGAWTFRQLNSFFDARLTQLPVVEPATTSTGTSTTSSGSAGTQSSGTTAVGFRDSRKGAWMQVGAYAPVYGPQTSWVHDGAVNTIFVAPLFRYGISTITGKGDGQPTLNAKGEADDVFHFYGVGLAFGHQKLSGTINQTPELISYLSIAWGHNEAFNYVDANAGGALVVPMRAMVEGRLKIPATALQIGFNADMGKGHDDLRFIFGTRFDIGEAFAKLKGFEF